MKKELHPLLTQPIPIESGEGVAGIKKPLALARFVEEDITPLLDLTQRHIVTARQFSAEMVVQLTRLAASYESSPVLFHKPLAGKILISAFYEPSTRTRLSFESAWHRLGGDIMSITDASTTGIAKGESLEDVAEMFNNYGDVVVLRDSTYDAVYKMLGSLRIPIINAGNGIDEHPTQALSDMYAIFKWRPELTLPGLPPEKRITFGIIGTPHRMRTVRSLLLFLSLFPSAIKEVVIINDNTHPFDEGQREELTEAGLAIRVEPSLDSVLPELDVVYINSIAWVGDSYEELASGIRLNASSPFKEGSIILHPLARGAELDTSLDRTSHNWYFSQARGAVFLRMALLTCLVQRVNLVMDAPDPSLNGEGDG